MANSAVLKIACCAVVAWLLVSVPQAAAEVTCSQVTELLTPCVNYLIYGGEIPSDCCAGVKQLNEASESTEDRRTACSCIQSSAAMIPGIDYSLVASLPSKCGVSLPYKISPSTDCSRFISFYPLFWFNYETMSAA